MKTITLHNKKKWGLEITKKLRYEDLHRPYSGETTDYETDFKTFEEAIKRSDELQESDDTITQIDLYEYTTNKGV